MSVFKPAQAEYEGEGKTDSAFGVYAGTVYRFDAAGAGDVGVVGEF